MRNPWLTKNPLMSMWLSAFNTTTNAARRRVTAEANRQAAAMIGEGTRQALRFWSGGSMATPPARPRKRKRAR